MIGTELTSHKARGNQIFKMLGAVSVLAHACDGIHDSRATGHRGETIPKAGRSLVEDTDTARLQVSVCQTQCNVQRLLLW